MALTIGIILGLIASCAYFAYKQGISDFKEIEHRKQFLLPKELDHGALLLGRVLVCTGMVGAAMIVETWGQDWTGWTILDCIYMGGVAFGSFTMTHRYGLNKARGLDWRYINFGNKYDEFWLNRTMTDWWKTRPAKEQQNAERYRAGTLAYITEAFTLCLSVVLLLFTN